MQTLKIGTIYSSRLRIAYLLWQMLVNSEAHLYVYLDSGHGFLNIISISGVGLTLSWMNPNERRMTEFSGRSCVGAA
jgi:hypothetical protein